MPPAGNKVVASRLCSSWCWEYCTLFGSEWEIRCCGQLMFSRMLRSVRNGEPEASALLDALKGNSRR